MSVTQSGCDVATAREHLYSERITALRGAFSPQWAARMRQDIGSRARMPACVRAEQWGAGRTRYYVEIHPEQLSGFIALIAIPGAGGV